MKTPFFITCTIFVVVLLIASCSKNDSTPSDYNTKYLKSVTTTDNEGLSYVETYFYDGEWNIIEYHMRHFTSSGDLTYHKTITYDKQNDSLLVISQTETDGSNTYSSEMSYQFFGDSLRSALVTILLNEQGVAYQINSHYSTNKYQTNYHWENGNVTQIQKMDNDITYSTTNIEYFADLKNPLSNTYFGFIGPFAKFISTSAAFGSKFPKTLSEGNETTIHNILEKADGYPVSLTYDVYSSTLEYY